MGLGGLRLSLSVASIVLPYVAVCRVFLGVSGSASWRSEVESVYTDRGRATPASAPGRDTEGVSFDAEQDY